MDQKVIAIDGMGGDNGPDAVFAALALEKFDGCHFLIFGDRNVLDSYRADIPTWVSYEIRHADTTVTSDMDVASLRTARKSGMAQAIEAVRDGEAQAVVSSGNTGLYFALAKIILHTIEGIDRPALATVLPGQVSNTVCLDLGANAECNVRNMLDFGVLGEALARCVFHKDNISVSLLNIGSEDYKGNTLVKESAKIFREAFTNYRGFVEGDGICKGECDVIVTDGFTGNVALKSIEGAAKIVAYELKKALMSSWVSKLGALLARNSMMELKKRVDPRLHNGAIFAGLNGIAVKSHGNSDGIGFHNALKFTINTLDQDLLQRIKIQLEKIQHHYNSIMGDGQ